MVCILVRYRCGLDHTDQPAVLHHRDGHCQVDELTCSPQILGMPTPPINAFKGHRFSREIISHAVWLYYRFSLSLRDVEDILAYRGIDVSHQTIHEWEQRFGPLFADVIRRNRPRPGDKWFLDEAVIQG